MKCLYDLRDWIYECDRFLFLAEVHYRKPDVVPSDHEFNCDFDIGSFESIFESAKEQSSNELCCIRFDTCVSDKEFLFFKTTLECVVSEKWAHIEIRDILRAQEILHEIAKNLINDIRVTHEMQGHPSLHEALNIN